MPSSPDCLPSGFAITFAPNESADARYRPNEIAIAPPAFGLAEFALKQREHFFSKTVGGLEGFGLNIVERVPLESSPTAFNIDYLRTKRERLGHMLGGLDDVE